jgi:hypothetical protein
MRAKLSFRALARLIIALPVAPAVMATAAAAQTLLPPPAGEAAFAAAMRNIQPPKGTGGCILLTMPQPVRVAALGGVIARQKVSEDFKAAAQKAAPACTTRPYARSDSPLVGAVTSALGRAGSALALTRYGVGQDSLDQAWANAPAKDKAPFYTVADEFLGPGMTVTTRGVPTAPLATRAGLAEKFHAQAELLLREYYLNTAIAERAEAILAPQSKGPAK